MEQQDIRLLVRLETKMDALQESFREFKTEAFAEFKKTTHESIEKVEKRVAKVEAGSSKVSNKVWMIMGGIAVAQFVVILAAKFI